MAGWGGGSGVHSRSHIGGSLNTNTQCALHLLLGPGTGNSEQVVDARGGTCVPVTCELRGTGAGSAVDVYLYGWNTGGAWGGGSGSLMILAGVLVHRAARPQRQSVFLVVVAGRYLVCRFN